MNTAESHQSIGLFSENKEIFPRFLDRFPSIEERLTGNAKVCAGLLRGMIVDMNRTPMHFDMYCGFNLKSIGGGFFDSLRVITNQKLGDDLEDIIYDLFVRSYRFIQELSFSLDEYRNVDIDLYFDSHLEEFPEKWRRVIVFANNLMPTRISKHYLDEFKDLKLAELQIEKKDWKERQAAKEAKQIEWDAALDAREKRVKALQAVIEKQISESNFVALNKGFGDLRKRKKTEASWARLGLVALGVLLLGLPIMQICSPLIITKDTDGPFGYFLRILPLIACEIVVLYFFRIVLGQYHSVKAQLLQLDLRIALCQFIESYAEGMMKIKKDDPGVLQKFESLIFSGLMTDGEKIPSVLDGAEQLANLIRSFQGRIVSK